MDKQVMFSMSIEELFSELSKIFDESLKKDRLNNLDEKLLTTKEVCELLRISRPTLERRVKENLIKKRYIGNRIVYKYSEIMESLRIIKNYKHDE